MGLSLETLRTRINSLPECEEKKHAYKTLYIIDVIMLDKSSYNEAEIKEYIIHVARFLTNGQLRPTALIHSSNDDGVVHL
jgi:hypothetical protein